MKGEHPDQRARRLGFSSRNTFLARVTCESSGPQFLCEETGALASYTETISSIDGADAKRTEVMGGDRRWWRGKSSFGRYLAREHDFAHYDLECHPRGWPHPDLKAVWDASRQQFIRQLGLRHERVALDWGFPVRCLTVVRELQGLGVRLIWFNGDGDRAREVFVQRGGIDVACFDRQMHDIRAAGYPDTLGATVVPVLSSAGTFLDWTEVERIAFA